MISLHPTLGSSLIVNPLGFALPSYALMASHFTCLKSDKDILIIAYH